MTEQAAALPRGHGIAAWRQIADRIAADIGAGLYAPGAQLPTEATLAAQFRVNRHTVRRALAALATQGSVRTTQGSGTFVERTPLAYPIGPRTRFSEIVAASGRDPGGALLAARNVPATAIVAGTLGIVTGAPVLQIDVVRSADSAPISTSISYLPLPRFDGIQAILMEHDTLSDAFARFGVEDYRRRETRITARPASAEEAARLELTAGRVVLVVDSVNIDRDGVPIQATTAFFAADRVEILVKS